MDPRRRPSALLNAFKHHGRYQLAAGIQLPVPAHALKAFGRTPTGKAYLPQLTVAVIAHHTFAVAHFTTFIAPLAYFAVADFIYFVAPFAFLTVFACLVFLTDFADATAVGFITFVTLEA